MAKVRWHAENECWTANLGEPDKRNKRKPLYKPFVGIPNTPAGRRDAQRVADEFERTRTRVTASAITAEDLVNLFLAATKHTKRPGTDRNHQNHLQYFCDFKPTPSAIPYGERPAASIHVGELQAIVDHWQRLNRAPSYISHLVSSVRQAWAWGAKRIPGRSPEQLIPPSDVGLVEKPKLRTKQVAYTPRSEIAKFLRFIWRDINDRKLTYPERRCSDCYANRKKGPCRRPHHADVYAYRETVLLIRFAMNTGCRPGEARELEWSEINWDQGVAVQYKGKKWLRTGKPRVIVIPPLMLRALKRHRDRGPRDDRWCFTNLTRTKPGAKKKPPRMPWTDCDLANRIRWWRKAAKQARVIPDDKGALSINLYKLRHASVSDALHAGVSTAIVAELHGTSERMIEETYGHIQVDALKRAAEQIRQRKRPGSAKMD